jgi:hypothetical protein
LHLQLESGKYNRELTISKWRDGLGRNAKFLLTLIFKNGFVGDIAFSSKEEIFPESPLALF